MLIQLKIILPRQKVVFGLVLVFSLFGLVWFWQNCPRVGSAQVPGNSELKEGRRRTSAFRAAVSAAVVPTLGSGVNKEDLLSEVSSFLCYYKLTGQSVEQISCTGSRSELTLWKGGNTPLLLKNCANVCATLACFMVYRHGC